MSTLTDYTLQQIKTSDDLDDLFYHGFFEVYSDCFGTAPYYERFQLENVKNDFYNVMSHGVFLCLKESNGRIAAFVAGSPLKNYPNILEVATKSTNGQIDADNLNTYWYHSEIGVTNRMRGKGCARKLWDEILRLIPNDHTKILARTHKHNDDSVKMHERFGFTCIPDSEHIVNDGDYYNINHRSEEDDTRIFLIRN